MCAFPSCGQPVSVVGKSERAAGRPARYCGDGSHNRQAAYLMRRREQSADSAAQAAGDRAVSMAGGRLRLVAESIGPMLVAHRTALVEQVEVAVAALTDLEDLTGLETELAAVRAQASQQVMNSEVATAEALQLSEQATGARDAALESAELATAREQAGLVAVEQANLEVTGLKQELAAMRAQRDQAQAVATAAQERIGQIQVVAAESAATARAAVLAQEQADERAEVAMDRAESQVERAEQRADAAGDKLSQMQVLLTRIQVESGRESE